MAKSMTAFGRCRSVIDGKDITVEIKAVNSKTLEVTAKLPRAYSFAEEKIKPAIQNSGIARGKVEVYVSVVRPEAEGVICTPDLDYAESYIKALYELRDRFGLKDDISVMTVAANRNVITETAPPDDLEGDWLRIQTVLNEALAAFDKARTEEGERLRLDVLSKLGRIRELVDMIAESSLDTVKEYEARLRKKLTETLESMKLSMDDGRIITECAVFADRVAVDEELVRLNSHIKGFTDTLNSGEPSGRRLDFWCQEMNREANTCGSKCQNSKVTETVVELKNEIEKIREQIQNIE